MTLVMKAEAWMMKAEPWMIKLKEEPYLGKYIPLM